MISRSQIDKAGKIIRHASPDSIDYQKAISLLAEWRKSHAEPLRVLKADLDSRLKYYPNSISAQSLKRMPTILDKLKRRESGMRTSAMQDIGGIRAILDSVSQVEKLSNEYIHSKQSSYIIKQELYQ